MKVIYDRETDSLTITLQEAPIRESDEVRPGVIADFGEDGGVVRFESCAPRGSLRTPSRCSSPPADGVDDGGGEPLLRDHRLSPASQRSICVQKVAYPSQRGKSPAQCGAKSEAKMAVRP